MCVGGEKLQKMIDGSLEIQEQSQQRDQKCSRDQLKPSLSVELNFVENTMYPLIPLPWFVASNCLLVIYRSTSQQ